MYGIYGVTFTINKKPQFWIRINLPLTYGSVMGYVYLFLRYSNGPSFEGHLRWGAHWGECRWIENFDPGVPTLGEHPHQPIINRLWDIFYKNQAYKINKIGL